MSVEERWVCLLAATVGLGCWWSADFPLMGVIGIGVVGVMSRSRSVIVLAVGAFACWHAHYAWQGLDRPLSDSLDSSALLISDPKPVNQAINVEVRLQGRHYEVWSYGLAARSLRPLLAGDRVHLIATTRPLTGRAVATYRRRHIAGSLNVTAVSFMDHGNVLAQGANGLRTLISNGARTMPSDERSLLTGFVYGDNRNQAPSIQADFRTAGLAHLLAVSGQNVAFVLIVVAPLWRSFSIRGRFIASMAALVLFGVITRWEPSVVRAEMMASVALVATLQGKAVSRWHCLALGTTLALLIDPFLIGSVGFLLSVMACLGMASFGAVFTSCLRGPPSVRRVVAYSAAAQIGVLPVQIVVFQQAPLVGLITNLLAEPLAGAIMVWGVVGGLAAGVSPWPLAAHLIHVPDTAMLWMVRNVATIGADVQRNVAARCGAAVFSIWIVIGLAVRPAKATVEERDGRTIGLSDQG